jgi:hypothetical protein
MPNKTESEWWVVKGLHFLNGMFVKESRLSNRIHEEYVDVERMLNRDFQFGDRNLSFIFPSGSLLINRLYLDPVDNPILRQFDTTNPWGKVIEEGRRSLGDLSVVWTEYDKDCLGISVIELSGSSSKTIYSSYFFGASIEKAKSLISSVSIKNSEDVIFKLRKLKEEDLDVRQEG